MSAETWTVERIDAGAGRVVRVAACRTPDDRLDAIVIGVGWASDPPTAFGGADLLARAVTVPPAAIRPLIAALTTLIEDGAA